jgi:hypothetical protein
MKLRSTFALVLLLAPAASRAQHGGGGQPVIRSAPAAASQYNFLVGQWELEVHPLVTGLARIHGTPKFIGTWKAWRAFDGWGIEDEMKISDGSGNPRTFTHAMRVYDANAQRWTVSSLDVYNQKFATATAKWTGTEINQTSSGTDAEGKPYMSRTRVYDIRPNSFKWQQDRSTDGGRTWTEGTLRIEAKRVSATATR